MAMQSAEHDHRSCISGNRDEYGPEYHHLSWIKPEQAILAEEERRRLLTSLVSTAVQGAGHSKLAHGVLAPGCRHCLAGQWSCLFINNRCQGSCFFCPTPQKDTTEPATNAIPFSRIQDYKEYLETFAFSGASLSGGEPLLNYDRSLHFIRTLKKRFGNRITLWLYTNGLAADRKKLEMLGDAGLDEIRFNIAGNGYRTDMAEMAVNIIPTVTVEIPAIPEDENRVKIMLVRLQDAGISHVNLHQLRLTPFNLTKLRNRPYTFLHGPKATVLESELAALRLLKFSQEKDLKISVHYCSFIYKHRYQMKAARERSANLMVKAHESITPTGLIRVIYLNTESPSDHAGTSGSKGLTNWIPDTKRLEIHPDWLSTAKPVPTSVKVRYDSTALFSRVSYQHPFRKIILPSKREIIVERREWSPVFEIPPDTYRFFPGEPDRIPSEIQAYEMIPSGLYPYY